MKKGQIIQIVSKDARVIFKLGEMKFGKTGKVDLFGEVVAVSPTVEEYIALDETFAEVAKGRDHAELQEALRGDVIYYDLGADRHFTIEIEDVEVIG